MKLKNLLSFLLATVMIISLLPTVTYAADTIGYLDWDNTKKELVSAQCTDYTVVTSTTGTLTQSDDFYSFARYVWEPGWYVVKSDVTIDKFVQLTGTSHDDDVQLSNTSPDDEVHLILCDGATLTLPGICNFECSLSIYGQNSGSGKLEAVNETEHDPEEYRVSIKPLNLTVNGGTVTVKEGCIRALNFTMNSGTVTTKGGVT